MEIADVEVTGEKLKKQINASQMREGDVIFFEGAEFVLGEVNVSHYDNQLPVYYALGVCNDPSETMINNPYFYNAVTGRYTWVFQGNKRRMLTVIL